MALLIVGELLIEFFLIIILKIPHRPDNLLMWVITSRKKSLGLSWELVFRHHGCMSKNHTCLSSLFTVSTIICLGLTMPAAQAQDPEKAPFDPKNAVDGGLGMPSPYDKFLGLAQLAEGADIDWRATFNAVAADIDPDEWQDASVAVPLVLGLRIADGIMAIQARDAEFLGQCASDIEKLAPKVGVGDAELERARKVRTLANEGDWLKVFMELGFLQQDILKTLARDESNRGDLVVASGWMQGARYSTSVVLDNYSDAASNILREPKLVKAIADKLATQPDSVKEHPSVAKMLAAIPQIEKIVDVAIDALIAKEDVQKINALASDYAASVLAGKK